MLGAFGVLALWYDWIPAWLPTPHWKERLPVVKDMDTMTTCLDGLLSVTEHLLKNCPIWACWRSPIIEVDTACDNETENSASTQALNSEEEEAASSQDSTSDEEGPGPIPMTAS